MIQGGLFGYASFVLGLYASFVLGLYASFVLGLYASFVLGLYAYFIVTKSRISCTQTLEFFCIIFVYNVCTGCTTNSHD